MLFSDSFGHNTHSSTMLQNEVLDYFEKLLLKNKSAFLPSLRCGRLSAKIHASTPQCRHRCKWLPSQDYISCPHASGGATWLPMKLEQQSLEKLRSRCFLHTSPFCCLGTPSIVNLEVLSKMVEPKSEKGPSP